MDIDMSSPVIRYEIMSIIPQDVPVPVIPEVYGQGSVLTLAARAYIERNVTDPLEREKAMDWWECLWNRPSKFLDGRVVDNFQAFFMHIGEWENSPEFKIAERAIAKRKKVAGFSVHKKWEYDCQQRKTHIAETKAEAIKRRGMRRDALAKMEEYLSAQLREFKIDWDKYVGEAETAARVAKDTPVPPRP